MKCGTVYPAHCIIWSGSDIPELGIVQGSSTVQDFLTALYDKSAGEPVQIELQRIDDVVSGLSANAISADNPLYEIGINSTKCAAEITTTRYSYNLTEDGSSLILEYDATPVRDHLPSGYEVVSKSLRIQQGGQTVVSAGGIAGRVSIAGNRLPATALFQFTLQTPCGVIYLQDSIVLASTAFTGEYARGLKIVDAPNTKGPSTQADVNDQLAGAIAAVRQEVFNKQPEASTPAVTSTSQDDEIEYLKEKIDGLQRQINNL